MKKVLFLLAILPFIALTSCSKDDDEPESKSAMTKIYGEWKIDEIFNDDEKVMKYEPWPFEETTATFNPDGSYSGKGYFGNGTGTYKIEGLTIICYISGEEYLKYDVIDLFESTCTLRMYMTGSNAEIKIKCKKE